MNKHSRRIFVSVTMLAIVSLTVLYLVARNAMGSVVQRSELLGIQGLSETMESATWPLQIAIFAAFFLLSGISVLMCCWPSHSVENDLAVRKDAGENRDGSRDRDGGREKGRENLVIQAQKMEAVGRLALGVAHDFNNLLTGINGNLAIAALEIESTKGKKTGLENLKIAIQAGQRAAELVKKLLRFSRRDSTDAGERICVNEVVDEVKDFMEVSVDPSIEFTVDLQEDPWELDGDPGMVSQILINLATNAADAIIHDGRIRLATANRKVTLKEASKIEGARAGEFVRLTVEDNGVGISPEVKERMFEPFFTTKERGKGTGIGLATSLEIINQFGGWITVDCQVVTGSRFDIYLPRGDGKSARSPESSELHLKYRPAPGGAESETILIVDDDDMVRNVASSILERSGYHILTASNGLEALEIYTEQKDSISLVMLDLTMPKLSGQETYARLRSDFDYVPILICSGYLIDVTAFQEETGSCPDGFVQKPYKIDAIAESVRSVLDKAAAA